MSVLRSNLGLHGERPGSSCLRIGMPLPQDWIKVMVCFILLPLRGKTQYPLYRKLGGPQGLSGNGRKEKYLCSSWELNSDSTIAILYLALH